MSRALAIVLAASLWAGSAAAQERPTPPPPRPARAPEPAPSQPSERELSPEDREVVENLELLESMGEAEDLDLLLELSQED